MTDREMLVFHNIKKVPQYQDFQNITEKQYQDAIDFYDYLIRLYPNDAGAYLARAQLKYESFDADDASEQQYNDWETEVFADLDTAFKIKPELRTHDNMDKGLLHEYIHHKTMNMQCSWEELDLHPLNQTALKILRRLYIFNEAIDDLERQMNIDEGMEDDYLNISDNSKKCQTIYKARTASYNFWLDHTARANLQETISYWEKYHRKKLMVLFSICGQV